MVEAIFRTFFISQQIQEFSHFIMIPLKVLTRHFLEGQPSVSLL